MFLLNPNFLLAHRNKCLEGTDNRQFPPSQFLNLIPTFQFFYVCFSTEAFEILGWESAWEVDVRDLQYPYLSMFICHFVARIFGCKWNSVHLSYFGESGKHWKWLDFFSRVSITYSFSKVSAGLPGLCFSSATMYSKVPPWHFQTVIANAKSTAWV